MRTIQRIMLGGMLCSTSLSLWAQSSSPRLIVRADDMGSFHSANVACIEGYTKGIETCIEVMAVTPWFPEAVQMLKQHPGVDVGLHLTITSEGDKHTPHILNSVSKTFTATAVGLAIEEGLIHLDDKVISFFPDECPAVINDNLKKMEIRHLLTMSSGHDVDPSDVTRNGEPVCLTGSPLLYLSQRIIKPSRRSSDDKARRGKSSRQQYRRLRT